MSEPATLPFETTGPGTDADNVEADKPLVTRSSVAQDYTPDGFSVPIPRDLIVLGLDVVRVNDEEDFVLFYAGKDGDTAKTHLAVFYYARVGEPIPRRASQHLALKLFNGEYVAVFASKDAPINLATGEPDPTPQVPDLVPGPSVPVPTDIPLDHPDVPSRETIPFEPEQPETDQS
jgi:hypothetical protein